MNDIYTYTIPIFTNSLGGLRTVLTKAQAYVAEKGLDEQALLADKLWDDMFPLAKQVQIACDNAKGAAARLSHTEAPKFEDNEATLAELIARVDKTVAFMSSIPESAYAKAADAHVTFSYTPGKYLTGFDYAREYAIPNFFFHYTTAYGLLRKAGVPIGKADFVGVVHFRDEA